MPKKNNAPARVPDCHPEKRHLARGLCKQCYDKEYGSVNRTAMNIKARNWAKNNPERAKAIKRKHLYGIDQPTFQARLNAQDGKCKICAIKPATDVDHNHKTGRTRSILCGDCNRALGLFRDSPEVLRRAADYIELWGADGK